MSFLKEIFSGIQKIFFPYFCTNCKKYLDENNVLCDKCIKKIKPKKPFVLKITKKYSIKIYILSEYKDPIKKLVLAKNYSDPLPSKQLAKLILKLTDIKNNKFDYIVPIPLHWTRYAKRGFNQTEIMAKELSKGIKTPVYQLIKRRKKTIFQYKLSRHNRKINLYNAFEFKKIDFKNYRNKHLLLVDDLLTTGTTLKEAGIMLSKLQPASISAILACQAI